jgi:hypothetical protein
MDINDRRKKRFFSPRLLLACALFLVSGGLVLSAFTRSPLATAAHPSATSAPAASVALDPRLDHSFWNELMVAGLRAVPSFNDPGAAPRAYSMRAAAGPQAHARGPQPAIFTPVVSETVTAVSSLPLRDLPTVNPHSAWVEQPEPRTPASRLPQVPRNPAEADPVLQMAAPTAGMPGVGVSFEGMDISEACGNCLPPDTNGAVGPHHYVQMVNSSVAVYDKTGVTLMAPKAINSLWSVTPNSECFTHNNGDPIVLYDQLADRWLVSQFVVQAATENYAQCIAISQTADPTGAYYLYEFDQSATVFNDYPKLGVWPDGYYMSTNQFPNGTTSTVAAGAWVFERPKMVLGQPARYVFFDETPLATNCVAGNCTYVPFGQLPTTLDGKALPPAGTPNFFAEVDDTNTPETPPAVGVHDEMHIWKFHVDWNNPANSSFGIGSTAPAASGFAGQYSGGAGQPNFVLPIADYLASACQIENGPNDCSPEKVNPPQPPQYLDVLGDRLMFRLAYRNFGDHQALVVNHTVDTPSDSSTTGRNGVRWYELRNLNTSPIVYQQGTFAPLQDPSNPLWRWMGSAAMDHSGDLAIGYSASGPTYFPSLHYAGRLTGDPLNQLTQGEAVMFAGLGIEANTGIFPFRNRWGDYSALVVDPTDDCTFWYTNEYLAPNAPTDILPVDWHTRIGSFRFPQCVPSTVVPLSSVVSRMTHGAAGTFDIDLPLTGPRGIEPRSSNSLGAGNYTLVFTFANNLTSVGGATLTTGTGGVSSSMIGPNPNQFTVNLTGVTNRQYVAVTLTAVQDALGDSGNVVGPQMGVLIGDVNGSTVVDSGDVFLVRQQTARTASSSNFRDDVNATGLIDSGDVFIVRQHTATSLP